MSDAVLSVQGLSVAFRGAAVVRGVSFAVRPGECVAIVGESGSGKSVTARALLGLSGGTVSADAMRLDALDLLAARPRDWRDIRGGKIGLVLQDALVSLDPLRPVGREIDDTLRLHTNLTPAQRRARVLAVLESVGMPEPSLRSQQRAGELSGGLRQRALIASAIAAEPRLIIADEPTTALDATVQAVVLRLLGELTASGTALLLISHDLAVVREIADRVLVMREGMIVESGETASVLANPQHEYTRALIRSVPSGVPRGHSLTVASVADRAARPPRESAEPRSIVGPVLEARGLGKRFARPHAAPLAAVDDVSLSLDRGTTLGLVGESGSGKTTVARMLLGLTRPDTGEVLLDGLPFSGVPERHRRPRRRMLGAIYQDPLSSFDPRHTVRRILADAGASEGGSRSAELLDSVGLASSILDRRPLHLSGGQRQRVAIARALAPRPEVIICDEPVSALDVSVQAQVLDLLDELQREYGLAYLFISHDLGVVQHMSDRVAVMRDGGIVEEGHASSVLTSPRHAYTQQLLASAPRLDTEVKPT